MNKTIDITIRNKIATANNTLYICGNGDFVIHFDFDDEWAEHDVKTARFISGDGKYQDVVFQGVECPVPVISDTYKIKVGVYAGNLRTTTPAIISAKKSILCGGGLPAAPAPDVYAQIMSMLDGGQGGGSVGGLTWADLGESKEERTLLPETVVNDGSGNAPVPLDLDITQISIGDKLTVVFDGVSYPVTVADLSFLEPGAIGFGNLGAFELPSNDEPFFVVGIPTGGVMMQMDTSDDADHTIAIHGVVTKYNPIPAEYLPAGGGGGSTVFDYWDSRMCDMETGTPISADEFHAAVNKGPIYVLCNGEYHLASIYYPNGGGVTVKLWTGSPGYVAVHTKEVQLVE